MKLLGKNKGILILFLVALALRAFLILTARGIASDGCAYVWFAQEIASGNFHEVFSSILPPLFPIFTTGVSYIFQDFELSGRIVSCLFGSLTVFPLFFLIRKIFDGKIALITVLFFIVHPYLTQASSEVLAEALYFFFVTSIASLSWMAIQKRNRLLFLAVGLLLSLISLTRFEGFSLVFLVLGWIWLTNPAKIRTEIGWKVTSSFLCIIIFIIALFPYVFLVSKETGKLQVCSRQEQLIDAFFKPSSDNQTPLQKAGKALKHQISHNVPRIPFFLSKAYHPVFLLPLFFGIIGRRRFKGFKIGEAYILSFILFRLTILAVFQGINGRYLYAFIPMALCWAGTGFWEIDYRLREKFKDKGLLVGGHNISRFSLIILVAIMAICLQRGLRPIRGHRAIQRKAGYWLKENAEKKHFTVVSPSPQEAFHAEAKWYELKGKTYVEVLSNAKKNEADFIIIDKDIDKICPDFRDSVKADDLEILTRNFEKSSKKIVIYKLKK
jgi:4-amino-4-deoxy-L-arabinose transferase-like glycosyltransferase